MTTFENKLTDGITLEYEDIEITLIPALGLGAAPTAKLSNDSKIVTYETNDVTSFVYELTYTGFKEDIVVKEYTGQTEYAFTLFTNGLALCEEYGSYYLADADGNVKAKAKWKFEVKSDTQLEGQQMSNWCWAASARMFANHYAEVPASRSQSAAVSAVKGFIVNSVGNDTEVIQACNYYYSGSTTTNTMIMYNIGIYSEGYLTDYLNGGDVMLILRGPSEGVGHMTTIVGYTTIFLSGELEYRYIIYDPWPVAVSWPDQPIYTTGQILQRSYSWIRYGYDNNMTGVNDNKTWRYSIVLERFDEGG